MPWPANILGGLDPGQFLDEYWQKQPLLIRAAVPGFEDPLSPDELAGLACEEGVAARLVVEKAAARPWQVRHGPFDEADFSRLPPSHWTVLVQDLNRYVPALDSLLDRFNFVPGWRVDDVMASYAPPHGTVGPHTDNYDVFLLQGMGRRRWQINANPDAPCTLLDGPELRILANFEAEQEWLLEPGDMLYLPPGVQHYGVALEDCLTYSIGFRAPDRNELLGSLAHWLAEHVADSSARYTDPDLALPAHPGEVSCNVLTRVRQLLDTSVLNDWQLLSWFAAFNTGNSAEQVDYFDSPDIDESELSGLWQRHGSLVRNPLSRYAYAHDGERLVLCINGECEALAPACLPAVQQLCDQRRIAYTQVEAHLQQSALRRCWHDWLAAGHVGVDVDA